MGMDDAIWIAPVGGPLQPSWIKMARTYSYNCVKEEGSRYSQASSDNGSPGTRRSHVLEYGTAH